MKTDNESFGSCCEALADCLNVPNSFFRQESNGIWYLTIGYVQTAQGQGMFDQAVIFCPCCGKQLQELDKIARASQTE